MHFHDYFYIKSRSIYNKEKFCIEGNIVPCLLCGNFKSCNISKKKAYLQPEIFQRLPCKLHIN